MTSTWLADASRHSRHEAACGQRRLPLLPVGAPVPRAATPALPRAAAPGLRSSRPAPLEPLAPTPPPSLLMPE